MLFQVYFILSANLGRDFFVSFDGFATDVECCTWTTTYPQSGNEYRREESNDHHVQTNNLMEFTKV